MPSISEGTVGAFLLGAPTGLPPLVVLNLLVDSDPAARLLEGGAAVAVGEPRKVEDKELPTLVVGPRQGWMITLAIDPDTTLLREIVLNPAPKTLGEIERRFFDDGLECQVDRKRSPERDFRV